MTTNEVPLRRSRHASVDFTMMYAAHGAFRRDLRRLTAAARAGRIADPAVRAGWETFKNQLHIHHTVEDDALWPPLRRRIAGPDEVAVLDAMEAEHDQIDPLLSRVEASFTAGGAGLEGNADALADALMTHMAHEEDQALPLVESRLGPEGWAGFLKAIGKRQGLKGGAEFLPWVLDEASAESRRQVFGSLPPPARVLYRMAWRRSYARTPRWTA